MARNDGINRTSVRNVNLTEKDIGKTQQHNEREKESYANENIVPERSALNVHFKRPEKGYTEAFQQMEADGVISTRGLKADAAHYGEMVFDVNSAYFFNHGGYEYAKQFYAEAYKSAVKIVGGEQYILSAVMHADERNPAMSDALGQEVCHYHMHVIYIPVVAKQILWSKRCKDKALVGSVKGTVMQVSSSKKWASQPALDEAGKPLLRKNGMPVLKLSYSLLQDDFFNHMISAGYTDVERGERGSAEEHLTVTQFKVGQEKKRLAELDNELEKKAHAFEKLKNQQVSVRAIEHIEVKSIPFSSKVAVEREDYEALSRAAQKYVICEKREGKLQRLLDTANKTIAELRASLRQATEALNERNSLKARHHAIELERENMELREKVGWYRTMIERLGLAYLFGREKGERKTGKVHER